jgi:SpoVK/Ycf46/Vps4 family AAA+-type ATPase
MVLPTPRGLLLVGIQGTGKSLTAKAIANDWQLPLLKLDVGKLFGGIVGESESRLRQMINVAETISPCILWIDEIDKAFSNTESKGDSGTSNRVLATFISWLSEKTKPVFVIATANNIDLLPLEIIRKGRFDEIFFLDLPKKKNVKKFLKFIFKNLDQIVGNHLIIKISKNYQNHFQVLKFVKVLLKECIMHFMKNVNLQQMIFVWL